MYDDDPLPALFGLAGAVGGTGGLVLGGSNATTYVIAAFAAIVGALLLFRFAASLRQHARSR